MITELKNVYSLVFCENKRRKTRKFWLLKRTPWPRPWLIRKPFNSALSIFSQNFIKLFSWACGLWASSEHPDKKTLTKKVTNFDKLNVQSQINMIFTCAWFCDTQERGVKKNQFLNGTNCCCFFKHLSESIKKKMRELNSLNISYVLKFIEDISRNTSNWTEKQQKAKQIIFKWEIVFGLEHLKSREINLCSMKYSLKYYCWKCVKRLDCCSGCWEQNSKRCSH